jgi:hypothetical protein
MPVSADSTCALEATTAARSATSPVPARLHDGSRPAIAATRSHDARSSPLPVSTTGQPSAAMARATIAHRSAGQRRDAHLPPGCTTTTSPALSTGGDGDGGGAIDRSDGSAPSIPLSRSNRHQRCTSCSFACHTGAPASPSLPSHTPSTANATILRGADASRARWLSGPRPCRFTATSTSTPTPTSTGSSSRAATTSSTTPSPSNGTNGDSQSLVASTWWWVGKARRSARSAGTTVSRSPSPSARSVSSVVTARTARWTASPPARAPRTLAAARGRTSPRRRRSQGG